MNAFAAASRVSEQGSCEEKVRRPNKTVSPTGEAAALTARAAAGWGTDAMGRQAETEDLQLLVDTLGKGQGVSNTVHVESFHQVRGGQPRFPSGIPHAGTCALMMLALRGSNCA